MPERDARWWAIYTALVVENWRMMTGRPVGSPKELANTMQKVAEISAQQADLSLVVALSHIEDNP